MYAHEGHHLQPCLPVHAVEQVTTPFNLLNVVESTTSVHPFEIVGRENNTRRQFLIYVDCKTSCSIKIKQVNVSETVE